MFHCVNGEAPFDGTSSPEAVSPLHPCWQPSTVSGSHISIGCDASSETSSSTCCLTASFAILSEHSTKRGSRPGSYSDKPRRQSTCLALGSSSTQTELPEHRVQLISDAGVIWTRRDQRAANASNYLPKHNVTRRHSSRIIMTVSLLS